MQPLQGDTQLRFEMPCLRRDHLYAFYYPGKIEQFKKVIELEDLFKVRSEHNKMSDLRIPDGKREL
jgi:hypothetical protein